MTTTYIDDVARELHEVCPDIDLDTDPGIARAYTLLVLVKGTATTSRDVHDAWATARLVTRPDHPDIVPFDQLSDEVKAWDDQYRDAIHAVAARRGAVDDSSAAA